MRPLPVTALLPAIPTDGNHHMV
jgi:hypothetical protein